MTNEHLDLVLKSAESQKAKDGWHHLGSGRHVTLYVAQEGASLTVGRIESLRAKNGLVEARTARGEIYVLALESVFAASVDEAGDNRSRKAGFV